MNLRLVGTSTVNLADNTAVILLGFDPGNAPISESAVSLTANLLLRGTNAAVHTLKQSIQQLLTQAKMAQENGTISKVYLEADAGAGWKRTEVLLGDLELDNDYYDRIDRNNVPATLRISRKNYWEGAESAVPLTNLNSTNNTTGLNVFNANDQTGTSPNKRCNYADIGSAAITGDMPARMKLTVKNLTADASGLNALGYLWIGHNYVNPTTARWLYELESAAVSSGSVVTVSGASGGQGRSGTFSAGVTPLDTAFYLGQWGLSSAEVSAFAGQRVRLMLRSLSGYGSASKDLLYQVVLGDYKSDWVRPHDGYALAWLELFDFRVPQALAGLSSLGAVNLDLMIRHNNATMSTTWGFDDMQLIPADGYISVSTMLLQNGLIVLDGISENVYAASTGETNKGALRSFSGSHFELPPGKAQRLYFLQHSIAANNADIVKQIAVNAVYRPRWSKL